MSTDRVTWLNQPTRRRMLEAAEQLFADVGYDLARVDDIASTAAVSKSHLYYHFAGKAELMKGLVDLRTHELLAAKDEIVRNLTRQSLDDPAELATVLSRVFTEALQPRRRFIRIVLVEALKNSEAFDPVFAAINIMLDDAVRRFGDLDARLDARARALLFHFGIIPALFTVALDPSRLELDIADPSFATDLATVEHTIIKTLLMEDS